MKTLRFLLLCAAALTAAHAQAVDIYRWTDESGRVHLADTVPERYRSVATRIDSSQYLARDAELREAAARAERERAQAAAGAPPLPLPAPAPPRAPEATAPNPDAAEPGDAECAMRQRAYRASQDCFAPFRNVNGSLKPEALAVCREVADPTPQCGPAR